MYEINLGLVTFSLLATWAAPSLAAETEGTVAVHDPLSAGAPPGELAEQDGELSLTEPSEVCCCAGEDVGEATQCWDWQCAAAVVGGAIVGGLTGAPAGPWGVGAGAVGGGLLGFGTSSACTPDGQHL